MAAGCAGGTETPDGPGADVRALTGAHTRVVWVQGDGTDPDAGGDQLILMGFDTDDGKGERVILGERRSRTMPRLTPRGDRVVFSSRIVPGPPEIFVVNFDGTGLRKLADGFAMALWQNPADGSEWVYAGTDNTQWDFATVTRFPIDAPASRELVWNATMVSMEGFGVSADGRHVSGMFPWPAAGIADVTSKTWKKLGEGCYTSLSHARGPLFWYFDGAHRNVTMVDVDAGARWMVNLNNAPGFDGAEVSHPRWTNHPRFLTFTGPYNQGGSNQSRTGGKQTEVYIGRFAGDFSKVEAWARVTNNAWGDSHPDVWIDARSPHPRRPGGRIGPADLAPKVAAGGPAGRCRSGTNRGQCAPDAAGTDSESASDPAVPARARRQRIRDRGRRSRHVCGAPDSRSHSGRSAIAAFSPRHARIPARRSRWPSSATTRTLSSKVSGSFPPARRPACRFTMTSAGHSVAAGRLAGIRVA